MDAVTQLASRFNEGAPSMRFHPLNAQRPLPPADLGTSQPSGSMGETSSGSRSSATPLSASFSEFTQSRRPGDACNSYKPAQGPRAPCAADPRSWERGSPAGAAGSNNNLTELLAVPAIRDALHQMLGGQALASLHPRAQVQRAPQPAPSFGGHSAPSAAAIFRAAAAGRALPGDATSPWASRQLQSHAGVAPLASQIHAPTPRNGPLLLGPGAAHCASAFRPAPALGGVSPAGCGAASCALGSSTRSAFTNVSRC